MSSNHKTQFCQWACQWKGTESCAQCVLNSQSLADGRVSLGVLCGMSHLYYPNRLPPCIRGGQINWMGNMSEELAMPAC